MGVPTSEDGYTSATTGKGDHEVHKGHVVALEKKGLLASSFGLIGTSPGKYLPKKNVETFKGFVKKNLNL
jgi:hypothetical protein